MRLEEINALDRIAFVAALGWIFEDSPWVAVRAWDRRPFASAEALHAAMMDTVVNATRDEQWKLLQAHPDLGANRTMSEASAGEQSGAGLDRLSPSQFAALKLQNEAYREKFGFPFLFAVKGATSRDILEALWRRFPRPLEEEFREALQQVYRIAQFRIEQVIGLPVGS